jgi:hypothetical protein
MTHGTYDPDDDETKTPERGYSNKPDLVLVGEDGNAFSILNKAKRALHRAGQDSDWEAFYAEATSGDYDHLLQTCMRWFNVS